MAGAGDRQPRRAVALEKVASGGLWPAAVESAGLSTPCGPTQRRNPLLCSLVLRRIFLVQDAENRPSVRPFLSHSASLEVLQALGGETVSTAGLPSGQGLDWQEDPWDLVLLQLTQQDARKGLQTELEPQEPEC